MSHQFSVDFGKIYNGVVDFSASIRGAEAFDFAEIQSHMENRPFLTNRNHCILRLHIHLQCRSLRDNCDCATNEPVLLLNCSHPFHSRHNVFYARVVCSAQISLSQTIINQIAPLCLGVNICRHDNSGRISERGNHKNLLG